MRADTKYYHYFFAGLWLLVALAINFLVPDPAKQLFAYVGTYATLGLGIMLFAVCLSPLIRVVRHPLLSSMMANRRYIGVWGYGFMLTHVMLVYEKMFGRDWTLIFKPEYLMVFLGFVAFTIVTAMFLTSTDRMVRLLGGQNWKRLHSLVYVAIALAVIHAFNVGQLVFLAPWAKWALVGVVVLVALFKAKHQFKLF